MTNNSQPNIGVNPHAYDVRLDWAWWYLALGWQLFVVGPDKRPLPNCQAVQLTVNITTPSVATALPVMGSTAPPATSGESR